MQAVRRSPEPQFVAQLRTADTRWEDLDGGSRRRIRDALAQDFGPICAYCQQSCRLTQPRVQAETEETPRPADEESIDHFRPRNLFPYLRFDWDNMIYACYRCNQNKAGKWPVSGDMMNRLLTAANRPRYTPVSEYVNPNEVDGRRPAQQFFSFDVETGEMTPAEELDGVEWSIARRTIHDIDLNGELGELGAYDPDHIVNQRRYHLYLLIERLQSDTHLRDRIARGYRLPRRAFSAFISAYLTDRFPLLGQLFQQH